jgi:hypothetical protein
MKNRKNEKLAEVVLPYSRPNPSFPSTQKDKLLYSEILSCRLLVVYPGYLRNSITGCGGWKKD